MEEIINQIIKIFEDNNLSVAQAKSVLSITATKLEGNSKIKIKNE